MALEAELDEYAQERGLSNEQTKAFTEVFSLLDLDGGGILTDRELRIGLTSINMTLSEEEIKELTDKIDPHDHGINVVGFIKFMMSTPKYKVGADAAKIAYKLRKLEEMKNLKQKSVFKKIWRILVRYLPFLEEDDTELQHEAALVLQDVWRARQAKKKAAAEIQEKISHMKKEEEGEGGSAHKEKKEAHDASTPEPSVQPTEVSTTEPAALRLQAAPPQPNAPMEPETE